MLRLITDFDGPIADVSERYYQVYQFCLQHCAEGDRPIRVLSKEEFWQLKRARVPERDIAIRSGVDPAQAGMFARLRRQTVHDRSYLDRDRLVPGAIAALEQAQRGGFDLAVLTMRRRRDLDEAISRWNLERFFPPDRRYCIENEQEKTTDIEDKTQLMVRAIEELPPADEVWMVGDTEADLVAAQSCAIRTIAVLSGIRDRRSLERDRPERVVYNLPEAVDFLLQRYALATG